MSNGTSITTRALDQLVYHAVMEFAPWPMAEVEGKAHVVQAVNPSFCALLEKTADELIGKPIAQLFAEGHATHGLLDRVQLSGEAASHVETARNTPGPVYWSYTCWPLQAKDARHVGLMIQVTETSKVDQLTKDMNEALLISAVEQHELTDVADRLNKRLHKEILEREEAQMALRESEEFNRSITDSSPDCIKILDLEGNLLSMADRGQKLLCIPDITPYLNTPWIDFYQGEEDRVAAAAAVKKAAAGGEGNFIGSFSTLDGIPKWWDVRISPILDANGKPKKLLDVSRDVTERRQTELALEQTAKGLAEVDRHKSEFLATLAHELRNPLAPLRSGLEVLTMVTDDRASWDQAHGMMTRQLDQMVRLIDDLMDLSRITRGTVDLRMETVDLRTILEQAMEASRSLFERHEHTVVRQFCKDALIVQGDGMRLAQVFSNLLNNAAKYTDQGGVITVRAEVHADEARVTVQDNGIGIAEGQLVKVFDMFAQVERSNERVQGGLGIGLNIVKHLVGMHGGRISVHSEGLGKGSSFTVVIPLATRIQTGTSPITAHVAPAPSSRQRILVVDDNEDAANMMAMLLGRWGHEIRVANNGQQAIEIGELMLPRLIFMDLGMPVMDGHTACAQMKRTAWGRAAYIVALTGLGQEEDLRRSFEAGFDHHLVKPVESKALKGVIAALGEQDGGSS